MIDLRVKGLPSQIEVGGLFYAIKTDFREWLKFGEIIKQPFEVYDLAFLFEENVPLVVDFTKELLEFYENKNATPNYNDKSSERTLDYILDGEYIVGSFMSAYGIDLTSVDMHWHLFKALFVSLPDTSKITQIMGMRSYKKSEESYDKVALKNKKAWKLPSIMDSELEQINQEINDEFYNT
jgi:hypothetical protein